MSEQRLTLIKHRSTLLVLKRDEIGDLHDSECHLRNAAGQRLDDQGAVIHYSEAAFIAVYAPKSHEGGLLLVFWMHEYLVIAGESIQEAHQVMSRCSIDKLVDMRQGKGSFGKDLLRSVNTDPPFSVLFTNHHHVSELLRTMHFSNEPGV